MPVPKFKIRLGADHHLRISGKRYAREYAPDTFNCRAVLRCSSLQCSGRSDFTATEIEQFITSIQEIVANLKGQCSLTPKRVGSFGVEVAVANTGAIVTTVTFTTLTSDAMDATGWNSVARFRSNWDQYFHAIDVSCLNIPKLHISGCHQPTIVTPQQDRTKR